MSAPQCWLFLLAGKAIDGQDAERLSKLKDTDNDHLYTAAFIALRAEAESWLRGGMVIRPEDALQLSPIERDALVAAGQRLAIDHIASVGAASQSPRAAALARAPLDGGESYNDIVFDETFAEVVTTLKSLGSKHARAQ